MPDLISLAEFNELSAADACKGLLERCGSEAWATKIVNARPFRSLNTLRKFTATSWFELDPQLRIAAFNAKPRIGDLAALREKFAKNGGPGWDLQEQAGVADAGDEVLKAFQAASKKYEATFRFRFIISASGKTMDEMLSAIKIRLTHSRTVEIDLASEQNHLITVRRMFEEWITK